MMLDDARDLYQDVILRHSRAPLHAEVLDPFDAEATGDNPMCGDRCTVRLRFAADGGVARVGFQAQGCAISLASADLMAEAVAGLGVTEIHALARGFDALARTGRANDPGLATLEPLAGVCAYPSRVKCASLPWAAFIAALDGAGETSSE